MIGTSTMFYGNLLRVNAYDPDLQSSDDSELCERWIRGLGANFEISDALILESGKDSRIKIMKRSQMYGESDYEVVVSGSAHHWSVRRKAKSPLHPLKVDLLQPIPRLRVRESLVSVPFLSFLVIARYVA